MATYIDALNGDHTDGREQVPQMDTDKRIDLEHLIAQKLLEVVSQDDLENTYYDMQREWAETLPDEELMQTARDLGIDVTAADELTEIAQKHNMGYPGA
jgi:hypothetical protein